MRCYAVVDTNVIVSALIAKNPDSPPRQVFRAMLSGDIIPLYHEDILNEYEEVLSRKKFHLNQETIQTVLAAVRQFCIEVIPKSTGEILIDMDDLSWYLIRGCDIVNNIYYDIKIVSTSTEFLCP